METIEKEILAQLQSAKTKNLRIIAERIFLLESSSLKHVPEAQAIQNELWTSFQELSAAGQRSITRVDVVHLLTKVHPRVGEKDSQVITDLVDTLVKLQLSTIENLRGTPLSNVLDLLMFLQRPTRKNLALRKTLNPLLEERVKTLSSQGLEMYIRRAVNIEDYLPQIDSLSLEQIRNIYRTIDTQTSAETIKDVSPLLIYRLAERFIHDAKLSGKQTKTSSSRMIEKARIDQIVSMLLSKLSRENALITEHFIESLVNTSSNLNEIPTYFKAVLRSKINEVIKLTPPKEGEEGVEAKPIRLQDDVLLASLAAYRLFVSPLQGNQQAKLVEHLKSSQGKLNMASLTKDFSGRSLEGNTTAFDSMVLRGLRIVQKLQLKNMEGFKGAEETLVTLDMLNEVTSNVMEQVQKQSEAGRHYQVLVYLSALSDYPDSVFNYEENEQKINKIIKDAYKNISIRQAFLPFSLVQADERAQNSRKLAQKLMKEFSISYKSNLNDASTLQITKIVEKFTKHNWLIADTYNNLIKAFGDKFEEFSFRELATFNKCLSEVGLKQTDIVAASIDRLRTNAGFNNKRDATPAVTPVVDAELIEETAQLSNYQVSFSKVIVPFLETIVNLDIVGQQTKEDDTHVNLIEQLTEESFIKRAVTGDLTFFEQALREGQDSQHVILHAILKGRLDQSDPRFKELAEQLLERLNVESVVIDEATQQIFHVLNQSAESPLSGKRFSPKNIDNIRNAVQRDNKSREK